MPVVLCPLHTYTKKHFQEKTVNIQRNFFILICTIIISTTLLADRIYWGGGTNGAAHYIKSCNLDGSDVQSIITLTTGAYGASDIAVDSLAQEVYWCSPWGAIEKCNLDGSGFTHLTTIDNVTPWLDYMTIDPNSSKLWFLNSNTTDAICTVNLDGSNYTEVVNNIYYSFTVDPINNKIYYMTIESGKGRLWRANSDGTNPTIIYAYTNNDWPIQITINQIEQKVYWASVVGKNIEKCDFDGSNHETIISALPSLNCAGIAIDSNGEKIYWLDRNEKKLRRANLDGSNIEDIVTNMEDDINGLGIYLYESPGTVSYCAAAAQECDEYIESVVIGDINNNTNCTEYSDYTAMTTIVERELSYGITVTNGDPYVSDICGGWIDWNQDGDLDGPNEEILFSGGPATFTASVTPPIDAIGGETRMRVRIQWGGTLLSCGDTEFGEVEDYTITVFEPNIPEEPTGPGFYGTNWHDQNDNGQMDPNEPTVSGWKIFIDYNRDGIHDANEPNTITDANGDYWLGNLALDTNYYISQERRPEWRNTYPGAGGMHYRIGLTAEATQQQLNFGNYQLHNGTINGYKYRDTNSNGVWDNGEIPLASWKIYIDENDNKTFDNGEPFDITDNDGYYEFTNMPYGFHNVLDLKEDNWFQTYPGRTSGRLWCVEYIHGVGNYICELDLDTMNVINRFDTPANSIRGLSMLTAGPNTLFYCVLQVATMTTLRTVCYELDTETGNVIDQVTLQLDPAEQTREVAWHNGILYLISIDAAENNYLNGYDPETKALLSRHILTDMTGDGFASDPYQDRLLLNLFVLRDLFEIDPATGIETGNISQLFLGGDAEMTYTNGVLYKTFTSFGAMNLVDREDGYMIATIPMSNTATLDTIAGGIGIPGGHRIWIGKGDVTANFGVRPNDGATIGGTKFEDINSDGIQNNGEPGLAGWTIYIDKNGNLQHDPTEPSTTTGSDGAWQLTNHAYGYQDVREVPQAGYRATTPIASRRETIDISNPRDVVFDDQRNLLYITTSSGTVKRYDLVSRTFLSDINVGGSLHGLDISLDQSHLYITNNVLQGVDAVIHKVNLNTLAITGIHYAVDFGETGCYDIAIGANGLALLTSSASSPIRILDTNTDTVTVPTSILGEYNDYNTNVRLICSGDRSTIWLVGNNSTGEIRVYDATTNTFTHQKDFGMYLNNSPVSLNVDGSKGAIQFDGACIIVDAYLNTLIGMNDTLAGAQFLPNSDLFYQFQSQFKYLTVWDTTTWQMLDYKKSSANHQKEYTQFVNGETAASGDGRVVCITQEDYIVMHYNDYRIQTIPGKAYLNKDLGSKRTLCGDFDNDRDVDATDLLSLGNDWLGNVLQHDIETPLGDDTINYLDYHVFSSAWQSQLGDANWDSRCDVVPPGGDGIINNDDLISFTMEWLQSGIQYDTDIAGAHGVGPDGNVDLFDVSCLANFWGVDENVITYDESFETGDFSQLPWQHSGDGNWTIDNTNAFDGTYSIVSANLPSNNVTILRITQTCGDGYIYFRYKTELYAQLDCDVNEYFWSADYDTAQGWSIAAIPVTAGTHTIEWRLETENSTDNLGWIDGIVFPAP